VTTTPATNQTGNQPGNPSDNSRGTPPPAGGVN
jgi:hypothetical protein